MFHTNLKLCTPFCLSRDTCNYYKHAWACVCKCTHRRIHRKYSFVLHLVRASFSRINTFHGTGAYSLHLLLVFFLFSSSDVILSFSCRVRSSFCSCILYLLRVTDTYKLTVWCLSSRRILGLLVNEINDLCKRDFDENYMV